MSLQYSDLFAHRTDEQIRLFFYFSKPSTMTLERIKLNDKSAAQHIAECENAIELLKAYRLDMAQRYNDLAVMPYTLHLKLQRRKRDNVTFTLTITRTYEDGTEVSELRETYTGLQRAEAIKRYNQIKKERPGILSELAIEKGRFER